MNGWFLENDMDVSWQPEYEKLASEFLKQHFGDAQGLTRCLPSMRNTYPWSRQAKPGKGGGPET
jgi:hypothetical protein